MQPNYYNTQLADNICDNVAEAFSQATWATVLSAQTGQGADAYLGLVFVLAIIAA